MEVMPINFAGPFKNLEFEKLIEHHLDGLYRVALHYTRNGAQAEDLVQDTVVRALRFRDKFEPGTHFRAWIYTILTHTFIHRYRRSKLEREILTGPNRNEVWRQLNSEDENSYDNSPEGAYLDRMLSDDVIGALESLPEEFRITVVLCDIEGLSYKEIADTLDCPVGTVMSRLYRGRRWLEKRLQKLAVERGILKPKEKGSHETIADIEKYRRRKHG